jgi:glycosyltransferase involved in cell wall biosynthesis
MRATCPMKDARPAVTVIIPCRNAARTIAAAVRTALAQTLPPLEVLVVDDASSDGSGDVALAAGATVLRLAERRNAGGARNRGIDAARGNVLAFLDADVEIASDWLAVVAEVLASDSSIVAVGGRIINGRPGLWGDLDHVLNFSEWMSDRARMCSGYPTLAIAYRREAVGDVRFAATNHGEDIFFADAVQARGGRVRYEPRIRAMHRHERLDARSFWRRQVDMGRTFFVIRRSLDRPGKILFRAPMLLFLYPHLWIVLRRMIRYGMARKAMTLLPWLIAGETARIVGFFRARSEAADHAFRAGSAAPS